MTQSVCVFVMFAEFTEDFHFPRIYERQCHGAYAACVLMCNGQVLAICETLNTPIYYLCMFNEVEILLEKEFNFPKYSVLLSYQVVARTQAELMLYNYHVTLISQSGVEQIPYSSSFLNTNTIHSYLYTIWTHHGRGINVSMDALAIAEETDAFVNILDGPVLVESFLLYNLTQKRYSYKGGFRVTIGIELVAKFIQTVATLAYDTFKLRPQFLALDKHKGFIRNLSMNTMRRTHNQILYYKYVTVITNKDKYIRITFTNLARYAGASYMCEHGGFVLSDFLKTHWWVTGPFCTQHGTEPLVNDVRTFLSRVNHITFILYSYTFEMDVDITFEQTHCQGITNPCTQYCDRRRRTDYSRVGNYRMQLYRSRMGCSLYIVLVKGCVVLQETLQNEITKVCNIGVLAENGSLTASKLLVINNIR